MDLFVLPLVQQGYLNSCRPVCWLLSCSWGKRRYCFKQQYVWLSVPGDCQNHTADSDIHINLFSSYLQNRRQRCLVNCHLSYENAIKCGVPQGSILGPLLFLIFINDLPNCLNLAIPSMYADDTSLTVSASDTASLETQINQELKCVNEWLLANKLTLNVTKTEFMLITTQATQAMGIMINWGKLHFCHY